MNAPRRAPRRATLALAPRRYPSGVYRKKRAYIRKRLGKPNPTFVETYRLRSGQDDFSLYGDFQIPAGAGVGRVFKVRISDIPQFQEYSSLYRQYRINWVKVIVVPDFNTASTEANMSQYNSTVPTAYTGMARVVHAINDTPGVGAPATEAEVLEDNGCKIGACKTKWSVAFKPTPDIAQTTNVGVIPVKSKLKNWYNFDTGLPGNNPLHGSVSSYWSLPGGGGGQMNCSVYYKVSFSLRDPQ